MPEIMEANLGEADGFDRGDEVPPAEVAVMDRTTFGGAEHVPRGRVTADVLAEHDRQEPRHDDRRRFRTGSAVFGRVRARRL